MSGSWVLFAYSEVLQMLLAQGFSLTSHTKLFQQLTQHDSNGLGTLVEYKQIARSIFLGTLGCLGLSAATSLGHDAQRGA